MKCCKEFLLPDGKQIPFCAYNTLGYREQARVQLEARERARNKARRRREPFTPEPITFSFDRPYPHIINRVPGGGYTVGLDNASTHEPTGVSTGGGQDSGAAASTAIRSPRRARAMRMGRRMEKVEKVEKVEKGAHGH